MDRLPSRGGDAENRIFDDPRWPDGIDRRSLDPYYDKVAAELGIAPVPPEIRLAKRVEPAPEGFRVHYRDLASGTHRTATGRRVVLSAGTIGTNGILFRSRDEAKSLPRLSARLGHGFSGNGDFLGNIQNSAADLEPWRGPDVTSVMKYYDAAPEFTLAAPTFNREVMEVLAAQGQPPAGELSFLSGVVWPRLEDLLVKAFRGGLLSRPSPLPARNAGPPRA